MNLHCILIQVQYLEDNLVYSLWCLLCETWKCTNLVSIRWLPTTTGVGTYEFFTCTALWALVRYHLWMIISEVLALASDWLGAVFWYIVISLAFTSADSTRNWDRSGLWNCLVVSFMLFVPKIFKHFIVYFYIRLVCQKYVKVILSLYNFTCDCRNTLFLVRSSYSPYH